MDKDIASLCRKNLTKGEQLHVNFYQAIYENNKEDVRKLLKNPFIKSQINNASLLQLKYQDEPSFIHFQTPLTLALTSNINKEKQAGVVQLLLEAGADANVEVVLNKSEERHFSPLYFALSSGNSRLVKLLLKHKANPNGNAYQCYGEEVQNPIMLHTTPLDYINLFEDSLSIGEELVKYGADPEKAQPHVKELLSNVFEYLTLLFDRLWNDKFEPTDEKLSKIGESYHNALEENNKKAAQPKSNSQGLFSRPEKPFRKNVDDHEASTSVAPSSK